MLENLNQNLNISEYNIPYLQYLFLNKVDSLLDDKLDKTDLTSIIDDTSDTATDKTWSASKIYSAISAITGIEFIKPEDGKLPATGKQGAIYLIPNGGPNPNVYDEYIWINADAKFEKIGTTEIDLSGYVSDADMVEITTAEIDAIMTTVFGS